MANTGLKSAYFLMLVKLLFINMCVTGSLQLPETSNITQTNYLEAHVKQKRDANSFLLEYMIDLEVTISQVIYTKQIKSAVDSIFLPLQIDNSTEITDVNITTVCHPNETNYQCVCEDQYVWSYNSCIANVACDDIDVGTCHCINAIPSNREMCVPKSEVPIFEFLFEVDIDTIMIDEVKNILQGLDVPISFDYFTKVTNVDITTVCTWNQIGYQCRCEDQYVWPCDKCLNYGSCDNTSGTCNCINALPNDGQFCQTPKYLTNVCPTPTPTGITTKMSFAIKEPFDYFLFDKSSQKYIDYKKFIEDTIESEYKYIQSYIKSTVTNFRPGSVIVEFTVETRTTLNKPDFASSNKKLTAKLNTKFNVYELSFAQAEETILYSSNDNMIYPEKDLILTCPLKNLGNTEWFKDGSKLNNDSKHTIDINGLILKQVTSSDSGRYACRTVEETLPIKRWQSITILPSPSIQITTSKTVECTGTPLNLQCCVQTGYSLEWNIKTTNCYQSVNTSKPGCISSVCILRKQDCQDKENNISVRCQVKELDNYFKDITINAASSKNYTCKDTRFGLGQLDDKRNGDCDANMIGTETAICRSGNWEIIEDNCILGVIHDLIKTANNLHSADIPEFVANLKHATENNVNTITKSSATIVAIVKLLKTVSTVSQLLTINRPIMENILEILAVIVSEDTQKTWQRLNTGTTTKNTSSELLQIVEDIGGRLTENSFVIQTKNSLLNRTLLTVPFQLKSGVNSTTQINIPGSNQNNYITIMVFSTLNNVLPAHTLTQSESQTTTSINGDVVVIKLKNTINNISLTYSIQDKSMKNPQCVFWNFDLLDGIGGWDSTGCELKLLGHETDKFTCECNHTTSFSILMSPFSIDSPALAFITFIGVGISIICLILYLIIEAVMWKSMTKNDTAFMRHVSIVNIVLSLLIADICFIIGAAIVKDGESTPVRPCSAATFFMHFFYLVLFFWMLLSALLLFYRTIMVLSQMSRSKMMAIGFTVGYGAPLLIAVITVASTAGNNGYIEEKKACWLNWSKNKALLAFVIPGLTIVVINLLVFMAVLYKMLRTGTGAIHNTDEKHALVAIGRCVAILTPLFGITWGFGIGTMVSSALGIHVVFAVLNSIQGFFILVFGTLLDSKIREALIGQLSLQNISPNRIRSTSERPSSNGFNLTGQRRRGYSVAELSSVSDTSSNSDTSVSAINAV